jgi:hypothetical protein
MPGLGNDLDKEKTSSSTTKIVGGDELFNADVIDIDGKKRLATDANISSINVPLGKDPLPDTYFKITNAGGIGDEVTVTISATTNDTSTPDADLPAYSYTYTLVAADVGNEQQLALSISDALNADPLFENQFLEAYALFEDDSNARPVIHISSTKFSLNGEFYERPTTGDFDVTTTGTTTIQFFSSEYRKIVSRPKEVSLARDPRNPHRLGVQNISGTVFIRSSDPDALIREKLKEVGNPSNDDMAVNGQGVPVVFELASNPDGDSDIIIDSLKFYGTDTNIKVSDGNFLGQNSELTNGIVLELIRDGVAIFTEVIVNTPDMLGLFSSSASDNKIINQSGGDYFESTFSLIDKNLAFVLRNGESDAVRVTIRDNLTSLDTLHLLVDGSED